MGSWEITGFGNDTACDWAYSLEEMDDLSFIEETLQKVIETGEEYLEAPDGEEAIAAAEVIALLKGQPASNNTYPENVERWAAAHPIQPPAELIELAANAVKRILTEPSELHELWQESEEFESWKSAIEDLLSRITR